MIAAFRVGFFQLVYLGWAAPFLFSGPPGEPPWATTNERPVKRVRVTPPTQYRSQVQPTAGAAASAPNPLPTSPAASLERAHVLHASYMELLGEVRGHTSVHAHLGLHRSQTHSRVRTPPPQAVVQALMQGMLRDQDLGQLLDAVSGARVAHSIRDTSMSSYTMI